MSIHPSHVGRWARSRRVRLGVHTLAIVGLLSLLLPTIAAPPTVHAASFSNAANITIPTAGTATPYPSTINVSGLTGVVSKVKVTLAGYTHSFPDDVDILLVGPTGANAIIMSDVGGGNPGAINLTITLDDAAAAMPDSGPLTSGTFRPTNITSGDPFAAPAPAPSGGSSLSAFNLSDPNGDWKLFVVDDLNGDTGSIAGGWSLDITTAPAPRLIISELRFQGPSNSSNEFIEIYNDSDVPHVVAPSSGTGYGLAASDGGNRCSIFTGTIIPARGHYLCANSDGYSLTGYAGGDGLYSSLDEIPPNTGVALFNNNSRGASYTVANRLDAVGFASEANTLYKEGSGIPNMSILFVEHSFHRAFGDDGHPKDTNNNAADFLVVDTNGTNLGPSPRRLGAPGPENLSSPTSASAAIDAALLDPCLSALAPPNRIRDTTANPAQNSTFGTLDLRRTITNNTGQNITRLRFRIIDLTTYEVPGGTADLRLRTSTDVAVDAHRAPCGPDVFSTNVRGTTLEQPPTQPLGGGINSSLSVNAITAAAPLAPGASVSVRLLLGIQQTGTLRFKTVMEALPAGGGPVISVEGNTENVPPVTLTVNKSGAGQGAIASSPAGIDCGADCVESYPVGTVVTLTATPSNGTAFTGWTGACTGTGACQVTMDAAKSVTATFVLSNLHLTKSGPGSGRVTSSPVGIDCGTDCAETYIPGTVVTLTATPSSGSTFAGWTGACGGTGVCQVTIDGAKSVSADFRRVEAGVIVGPGVVAEGDKTLTATLTARAGCGPIQQVRFGTVGQSFNNARVGISAPAGGPSNQVTGFTYAPPAGTTSVSLTIQRVVQSGGATVTPVIFTDGCGEWQTLVGGGPSAFQ